MKKIKMISIVVLLLLVSGCVFPLRTTRIIGSGNKVTETRSVSGFNSIQLNGIGTLYIEQGNKESLEITADDNIIEYLENDVIGDELRLQVRDFVSFDPTEEIIYRLTVKDLEKIETSGLGKLEIGPLKTPRLNFEISGSGDAVIKDLQADSLILNISGLGNVKIAGKVETQRVDLSGAGFYDAQDLSSSEARIDISGTGKVIVWVKNDLMVELSGSGDFQYYGSPILSTEISGMGTVKSLGEK
ncbi:MAG: head GIN domain-containing protein [Pelolinea sp.]|nr:head GIN domain-containing protein [Pelolinea sp.]